MKADVKGSLTERVAALTRRIDSCLAALPRERARGRGGASLGEEQLEASAGALAEAEAGALLQARRCADLEERLEALAGALAEAEAGRERAELAAEEARGEAVAAFGALEQLHAQQQKDYSQSDVSTHESGIGEAFQAKLLEIERLTRERDALRLSSDEWRTRARKGQRGRDELGEKLEQAQAELLTLRGREEEARRRAVELERTVEQQRRELEVAERRMEHLRRHLGR